MSGMSDGVSKFWLIQAKHSSLEIQGCNGAYAAAWYASVWREGFNKGSEQRLRQAISDLERAVVDLKERVVEDYDLEEY